MESLIKSGSLMKKHWKKLVFIGLIVLGIAGFVAVPFIVGIEKTFACLGQLGWTGIGAFLLCSSLYMVIPAIGWKLLMHGAGHHVPYSSYLTANLMGFPLNYATPSLYLGGEPLKTIFIGNKHHILKRRVLATIIVSKFQELSGLALLIICATIAILWGTSALSHTEQVALITATSIMAIALLALMIAFIGNFKPIVKLIDLLIRCRIFAMKLRELRSKAEEMEQIIHESFVKHWKTFLISMFITLFSAVSIFIRPALFFYFLNSDKGMPGITDLSIIFVLTQLISIIQIVPGNLGIWEGGTLWIFHLVNRPDGEAVAFAIASRIADILFLVIGLWLILHFGMSKVARETVRRRKDPTSLVRDIRT